MTENAKCLVEDLLSGHYLVSTINHSHKRIFKLYYGNMVPVRYISTKIVKSLNQRDLLKTSSKGYITLNLSKVRQLHGNSWIKQTYKTRNHANSNL